MELISKNTKQVIEQIRTKTNNSPDIIIRKINIYDTELYLILNEALADKTYIDHFVLRFFNYEKMKRDNIKKEHPDNIIEYLEKNIPTHKIVKINDFEDLFYNLLSGFSIILVKDYDHALSLETRAKLDSGVLEAKNEMILKGPKDAFTENYQTNIGLIRKRLRTEDLWLEEHVIGDKSKTKVGIMYMNNIASKDLVQIINDRIKNIDIDSIFDSNYIIELISGNKKNVFANYISTERPDQVSMYLLEGRIAIIVENTQYVVVIPSLFVDFFHTTEDYYLKVTNANLTRIIRMIAFFITLLGPAIYIAVTTYNIEAVPEKLLLSFSTQREGVPLTTILETLMMIITFEILRETDTRIPSAIGSSLSIVGAIVLGQAAVSAGIVSPITIIVVAITAISGMIVYSIDVVNAVRWWRIIFMIFAGFTGLFGILIAGILFVISLTSIKSFGIPFLAPISPFYKNGQNNAIILTNKRKYENRNPLTTNNLSRQEENK